VGTNSDKLARQWRLLRLLSANGQATIRHLVAETGMSDKTIRRDLLVLRNVGFPLVERKSDHGRKHWCLENSADVPPVHFRPDELAALYLGRQLLEPLAGTYFDGSARSAFNKIRDSLGASALRYLEKLTAAIYLHTHGLADYSAKGELVDDLLRAIEDRCLTVITYQSLRSTEPVTLYDLHPYALAYHNQALYLIAWSCDHAAIRTFKVDRISSAETQKLKFTRPADFDPREFLAGSFGIFQGDGPPRTVRVRFSPAAVRILNERRFHSSQRHAPQPDGSLLVTFELSSFEELRAWLLSWGALAEVLEPAELRAEVMETVERMREVYGKKEKPAKVTKKPR
jgi:proteasome accessory factor B